jgi:hypothetical protein
MKEKNQAHWAMQEFAEQEASGNSIDLWPRIKSQVSASANTGRGAIRRIRQELAVLVLSLALLLIGSLLFVPKARAFAEDVFQRMGIAFVNTERYQETVVQEVAEAIKVPLPPSLSIDELRQQISFPILVPTWLPDGLTYVNRGTREYDPQNGEGSGKKVIIEYSRTSDFNDEMGTLMLYANDGLIGSPPLLAASREQQVTVNGQSGIYVHGSWQNDGGGDPNTRLGSLLWDDHADNAYLTWTQNGVTYLLQAHNLGLGLDDLLRIAGSMSEQP